MKNISKIISLILTIVLLISFPSNVFGQQGQLLQAEPSKVAMQALGLAKHYYSKGQFEKAAELRDRIKRLREKDLEIIL